MAPEQSLEEKRQIFLDVLRHMRECTFSSLSQVCGAKSEDTGELIGSGTIMELRGKPYLLTAHHVAKELFKVGEDGQRKYPSGLCHSVGNAERMAWVRNPWYSWPKPKDIAATRIDPVVLEGTSIVPLKACRFAINTNELNDDVYFVHGWPGVSSHFTTFCGRGVVSESQPYGGWLTHETGWPNFDSKVHIAITFPMTEAIDEHGQPATINELGQATRLPDPGGMSGSLLWKTNKVGAGMGWTPDKATVVGLVHRFNTDYQCLIATRIEYVKGFLLLMLREEFAYFRWIERGRPIGDDLADWVEAERQVTGLH